MTTKTPCTYTLLSAALIVLASACSGGGEDGDGGFDDPDADPRPVPSSCQIELSGAISGTYGCTATAGRSPGEAGILGAVGLNLGGELKTLAIAAELSAGDPSVKEYRAADFRAAGVVVQTKDDRFFFAASGSESDMGTLGAFKVTELDLIATQDGTSVWLLHGSFTATLVDPATQKTATLTARF